MYCCVDESHSFRPKGNAILHPTLIVSREARLTLACKNPIGLVLMLFEFPELVLASPSTPDDDRGTRGGVSANQVDGLIGALDGDAVVRS
jgi:hypothetical protein